MSVMKFCSGCNTLIPKEGEAYCNKCKEKLNKNRNRAYNFKRGTDEGEVKIKKFYNSEAWKRTKKIRLLIDNGMCVECLKEGRLTKATTVHHIIEVKEDWSKRFDIDNLISLCHSCHNKKHNRF